MVKKGYSAISVILAFGVCGLLTVACTSEKQDAVLLKQAPSSSPSNSNSILTEHSPDENVPLISVIQTSINDDIWYKGDYSLFKSLEKQEVPIVIYKSKDKQAYDYVVVEKDIGRNNGHSFAAIGYWTDIRGISNEITNYMVDNRLENLTKRIMDQGFVESGKESVKVQQADKPIYPEMTPQRKGTLDKIDNLVKESLKDDNLFSKDSYTITIRNYRDNDYATQVVVEKRNGELWIVQANLQSNGEVSLGKMLQQADDPSVPYRAVQYKKVGILSERVNENGSSASMDPVPVRGEGIDYHHKSLPFHLMFPNSWKGKYTISESDKGVAILQKYMDHTALLFEITIETETDWKQYAGTPEEEKSLPVKKIAIGDGNVYLYHANEEFPYQGKPNDEVTKQAIAEYKRMFGEIQTVISTFRIE